ncbi:MAG: 7TM diverse intracellular signaling domain-containing protein [Pseudomonas sp.]
MGLSSRQPDQASQSASRNHRPLLVWLLLVLLALGTAAKAQAAPPLALDGSEAGYSLQPHVQYLRDPNRSLHIEDVFGLEDDFQPAQHLRDLNFSYTRDHLWLRIEVQSNAPSSLEWLIEMPYASLDYAILYSLGVEGTFIQQAGDTLPYHQRSIGHRNPVFALHLAPGEQRTLYLLARSQGSVTLDSQIWNARDFQLHSQAGYVLIALYFGMLLALGGYNLLLFSVLRERSFLLYVCFVVSFGAGVAAFNGLGAQYIWTNLGEVGNRILPFSLTLSATVGVLFAQSFLDTARRLPRLDRLLSGWAWIAMIATLATLFTPVQVALQLMSATGLVTTLVLFFAGIICVAKRVPGARIFVLAWLMLLIGAMLLALRNFGLIPSNFLTINAMQIGSAMEMLLLSFGLAARFNEMKRLKEAAQQEALLAQQQVVRSLREHEKILEDKVTERTEALAQANVRLEQLAMQDPLTSLANRTALARHMQQAMQRTQRRGELLALVLIDLDGFKSINDGMGHEAGDQVLVQVAKRLTDYAREADMVARLGGDEFILVSEGIADSDAALQMGQRLLDLLSLSFELHEGSVSLGASIGICLSNGIEPDTDNLMRYADQAMYQRKRSGRHGVVLYGADQHKPQTQGPPS